MDSKYLLVTTAKNEAKNLPFLIKSVLAQEKTPALWLIFDDRSNDSSLGILHEAAKNHSFIRYLSLSGFNYDFPWRYHAIIAHGFQKIIEMASDLKIDWQFIAILDADINLEQQDYFKGILNIMENNQKIGIACGRVDDRVNNKIIIKDKPADRPAGAARVFSRSCLEKIEGYPVGPSGDSISTEMAQKTGFETRRLANYYVLQERNTKEKSGKYLGVGKYYLGMHYFFSFLFMIKLVLKRRIKQAFIFIYTFHICYFKRMSKIDNPKIRKIYRYKL